MDRDIAPLRDSSRAGQAGSGGADATPRPAGLSDAGGDTGASRAVTSLYQTHALGLTRLAFIMLGDRHAAEDVVQEAFCGLFRSWDRLPDGSNVVGYLRISVLNGCRTALRRQKRIPRVPAIPAAPSAEAAAMVGEEQRDELNILGVVTGHRFTPGESVLLPQRPSAYQQLQDVLRAGNGAQVAW